MNTPSRNPAMSTLSPPTGALPASLSDEALARESEIAQAAIRRRRSMIIGLRLVVLVVVLGGWELAARTKVIDPFFYSMPTMIWDQLVEWMRDGTSQGPLWTQVLVTLSLSQPSKPKIRLASATPCQPST